MISEGNLLMKNLATSVCLVLVISPALADDRLPQEEAQRYAKLCVEQGALLTDTQLKVTADPSKPCAVRGEGGGAMVIPDKDLSAKKLGKAGKGVIPVGQLWLRKWSPVVDGKVTPNDKLRIVTVNLDEKNRPMPFFLLGVRKGKKPELVVYARDSEPLLVLPLKKLETVPKLPLELEWKRGEKDADFLTLNVLGKYQTVMAIAGQQK
jgi:hypothetical protein